MCACRLTHIHTDTHRGTNPTLVNTIYKRNSVRVMVKILHFYTWPALICRQGTARLNQQLNLFSIKMQSTASLNLLFPFAAQSCFSMFSAFHPPQSPLFSYCKHIYWTYRRLTLHKWLIKSNNGHQLSVMLQQQRVSTLVCPVNDALFAIYQVCLTLATPIC